MHPRSLHTTLLVAAREAEAAVLMILHLCAVAVDCERSGIHSVKCAAVDLLLPQPKGLLSCHQPFPCAMHTLWCVFSCVVLGTDIAK